MKRILTAIVLVASVFGAMAQSAGELKNSGNAKMGEKKYADALELFEKYAAADAEAFAADNATNYNMGYAGVKSKQYDKAVKYFATSIEKGYKAEKAYYYTAYAKKKLNDMDGHIATLEAGIAKYPNSKDLKKTLSKVYFTDGYTLYKKAGAVLAAANNNVSAGKYDTASAAYKAETAKAKKMFADAIPQLDKALEIDAANANAKKIKSACTSSASQL